MACSVGTDDATFCWAADPRANRNALSRATNAASTPHVTLPSRVDVLPPEKTSTYAGPLWLAAGGLVLGGVVIVVLRAHPSKWSLLGLPIRVALLGLAVAALATAIFWRGHWWRHVLFGVLFGILGVLIAAGQINAHYQYFRTVGQVFGEKAAHQVSIAGLKRNGVQPPEGRVVEIGIPGARSGFTPRNAQVYLPPTWFRDTQRQFPVLMLLHGSPGFVEDWVRAGLADKTADAFAAQHKGDAPVIVMPDINGSLTGDSECVDSKRGNVETYLDVDVREFVISRFGTSGQPDKWAIAGLSEGGNCSLQLVLRHPELYRTFGDYAGFSGPRPGESDTDVQSSIRELFNGSQAAFDDHEPSVLLQRRQYPGVNGWFEVANDDHAPLLGAQKLAPLARKAGIDTCFVITNGGSHTFATFSRSLRDSLPWISARIGLVPKDASQTSLCRPGV